MSSGNANMRRVTPRRAGDNRPPMQGSFGQARAGC